MFGIGFGPSSQEKNQYGETGALANFATGEGEKDILASDNFWQAILSGDPSKISQVLGPQISGINKRAQQQKKTAGEFGNRGGGTNAGMQMARESVTCHCPMHKKPSNNKNVIRLRFCYNGPV